jgi:hypothetical protein
MNATAEVSISNPVITFYGPHPCDLCGRGPIIRGSVEQGFGDIRLDSPNEFIYPNHKWQEHLCGAAKVAKDLGVDSVHVLGAACPSCDENDEELKAFIRDSTSLKTKVDQRWSAWLDDREDGIVGTGATEIEAIKALAAQHTKEGHQKGCVCADCSGAELTSDND